MTEASTSERLAILAVYKLGLGVMLCAVALELVELLDRDLAAVVHAWVLRLHADPHNPAIVALMGRAAEVDRAALEEYAVVSGLFGNVHLVEGVGLWLRKHWAEYACIVSTALLVPLEVYELVEEPHLVRAVVLVINVAVVWYLVRRVRQR